MFNRKYLIYKLKSNSYESNMYFLFIKYILKSTFIYSIFLKSKKNTKCLLIKIKTSSLQHFKAYECKLLCYQYQLSNNF